jgi:hypothetical protein
VWPSLGLVDSHAIKMGTPNFELSVVCFYSLLVMWETHSKCWLCHALAEGSSWVRSWEGGGRRWASRGVSPYHGGRPLKGGDRCRSPP